jgi:hypothetical protein
MVWSRPRSNATRAAISSAAGTSPDGARFGQARRKIGKEQVGRMHPLGAARLEQIAVVGVEVQRMMVGVAQQLLEVFEQGLEHARHQRRHRGIERDLPALDRIEQLFGFLGDQRHTVDRNHLQRTVRLVDRRARGAQRGTILGVGFELRLDVALGLRKRLADLAEAPGKGHEIRRHGCSLIHYDTLKRETELLSSCASSES